MTSDSKQHRVRQPYAKPAIIRVPLKPDEAILGSCKNTGTTLAGPGNSNCHNPTSCSSLGS